MTNVDFNLFLEKAVHQSPVFYSLLQVYIVYRISFILVSVSSKRLAFYTICFADRGKGE